VTLEQIHAMVDGMAVVDAAAVKADWEHLRRSLGQQLRRLREALA
jgi:hypothetical protein